MPNFQIGKSTIQITVDGCIKCGIKWASGWRVAKSITMIVEKRVQELDLHICEDCFLKQKAESPQLMLLMEA